VGTENELWRRFGEGSYVHLAMLGVLGSCWARFLKAEEVGRFANIWVVRRWRQETKRAEVRLGVGVRHMQCLIQPKHLT
jgi:hypothetical protein